MEYTDVFLDLDPAMPVKIHRLQSPSGVSVSFIATGGAILAIDTLDRYGRSANVVLAHADPEAYRTQRAYFGAICGRYANRIAGARFELDGVHYDLAATDGVSSVHGGNRGFDKAEFAVSMGGDPTAEWAVRDHISPDRDQGYPGSLALQMTYRLDADGVFEISYEATTDRPTIVSLTNHSYFNLEGEGSGDVLGHVLEIPLGRYTPSDADLIPTGEVVPVNDTPFDFRRPTAICQRIRMTHPMLIAGRGYDVNYEVCGTYDKPPVLAAKVHAPVSGRTLTVETTAPGMQFYSGNNLDGTVVGPSGRTYRQSDAFCLEPHHYPNTPNTPGFPSARLDPGEVYRSRTRYRFGVADIGWSGQD